MMKFEAVAYFLRPIAGRSRVSTKDQGRDTLYATAPESAARKFLWSLAVVERDVTHRVIVWPPRPNPIIATYQGPTMVYERAEAALKLVEERAHEKPLGC